MTLRELIEQHPEWADLQVVVLDHYGTHHYLGCTGMVYESEDLQEWQKEGEGVPVLVMAPN